MPTTATTRTCPPGATSTGAIGTSGDVGIWHETYLVGEGRHESVYVNMPPFGLGRAGQLVPAKGRQTIGQGTDAGD